MRRLRGRASLLGVVLLTVLLAAGRGLPLRKPRGPWLRPRRQTRLAEVSGGAQGCVRCVLLLASCSSSVGSGTGTQTVAPGYEGPAKARRAGL